MPSVCFFLILFRDIIHESISDQLTSLLVLPHCLTIAVNNNYTSSTAYPLPQVRYSNVITFMSIALLYSLGNGIKLLLVIDCHYADWRVDMSHYEDNDL